MRTDATATRRSGLVMFLGVLALALVPRLVQVLLMSDVAVNPHWLRPVLDAQEYDRMARGLLAGTWPPAEPFFQAPLYPFLLGGLYALFGPGNMLAVMLAQALVSALGAGFAALAARRLWGERAGWLAGGIYALLWTSIFLSAELLGETFTVTLLLLGLWLTLRAEAGKPLRFVAAGLVLGLACLSRPNLLLLAPVWAWFAAQHRGLGWRSRGWALLVAGLAVAILPATVHNLVRGGAPVLIANSGGVNLYIGNNPAADGASVNLPDIPPTRSEMPADLARAAEREAGRALGPAAVDRHYLGKALRFWTSEPARALGLQLRKLRLLVAMRERSNDKHLYFWRERSALLRWPLWLGWTPVLLLAVLGFWRRDLARGERLLLLGSAAAFALTLAVFFVNGRFRLPLLAMLTIPAAAGLEWLWRAWRSRRWDVPRAAVLTAGALAVVSIVPDLLTYNPRDSFGDPSIWYTLGQSYEADGDLARAGAAYGKAVAQQRSHPQPGFSLIEEPLYAAYGNLLTRSGRLNEAQQLYADWVRANPASVAARVRVGDALLQAGRTDEAARQFAAALEREPGNAEARLGMAWVQLNRGQAEQARAAFEEIHRSQPNAFALFGSGLALSQLGRLDEAIRAFREVLVLEPENWRAWGNLGDLYDRSGRPDRAAEAFRKVLQLNPQDGPAREWLRTHPGA